MSRLILNLLGTFQVFLDGRPVYSFRYDKVRALLAYLAVESDRPHRREKLVGLLWPGYPESSARRSLTQALYHLRTALGDREAEVPFLLVTPQAIQLNPASDIQLDVQVLLTAWRSGARSDLEKVEAAYRGPFLTGLSIDDCPGFDEWVVVQREVFQQRAVAALHRLAEIYESQGQVRPAIRVAQREVALEPYWEEGQRTLMRLLAADGQRNAALDQYAGLRVLLHAELGVEPELATTTLYDQIRSARTRVTLGSALRGAGRGRSSRVWVVVLVAVLALFVPLMIWLRTGVRSGPAPWDPLMIIEGVSLWPEIDLQPWATNPILGPGEPGSWQERVLAPAVVDVGSRVWLYFTGEGTRPGDPMGIGIAGSKNRIDFTPMHMNNPRVVGDGSGFDAWAVGMPVPLVDGDTLRLYYAGAESAPFGFNVAIGRATADSPDAPWHRDPEAVLMPGGPGAWDSCAVTPGSVILTEGEYRLYYLGSSGDMCDRWMVGMAMSTDGTRWTKYDNPETEEAPFADSDPVLTPGDPVAWDGQYISGVAVRNTGLGWEMFFSGVGSNGQSAIGYAWSVEGLRWHRHPDNPVLVPEDDPYADDTLRVHDVTYNGSAYRLYYDYGEGNGVGVAEGRIKWPIVVNTTKDEINSDGDCSLREAIEAANQDAKVDGCRAGDGPDRVIVPGAAYRLTQSGSEEDANQSGDLDILDDLTLLGAGSEFTVLDGNGTDRVMHNLGARLSLDGLTLTNGRERIHTFGGGGLLNQSGSVTIDDCVISRNLATYGGGLANVSSVGATSTVTLHNTRVVSNTAHGNGGGVFQLSPGGVDTTVMVTVTRSTIAGNVAEGSLRPYGSGGGGGIISGSESEADGGATGLVIIDSTVSRNVAAGTGDFMMGNGGGIGITAGEAKFINCTISGNRAIGDGAASGSGGGIWVTAALGPASVKLLNCTVSENVATSGGGGVAALSLSSMCGETSNSAGICDAFLPLSPEPPTAAFRNTIVAGNRAPAGAACLPRGSVLLSGGHNLEDGFSCRFDQVVDLTDIDPRLGPLSDHGGRTWIHALLPDSPALDAASCPDLLTDQRGYLRPVDLPQIPDVADGCDIGAFELQLD